MERVREEAGFGLVELLIAMVVMNIALMAIVAALTSGSVAVVRAGKVTTAATMADAQMETYRAMTSKDIGLDTTAFAGLDTTYKNDGACYDTATSTNCTQAGAPASKALIGPTGSAPDTCATINGWYTQTLPCTPSRLVSSGTTPASPDGKSYRIDTYISQIPATATGLSQRARKQVTVVVRDGALLSKVLARETSIFDCSTGITPNSTDC